MSDPSPAPLKNPRYRHISRSAAKRESVQLLGSIRDLQLRFSQAGLVEHRSGAGVGIRSGLGEIGEKEGEEENVPPSSSSVTSEREQLEKARRRHARPWKEVGNVRMEVGQAKTEASALVVTIKALWELYAPLSPVNPTSQASGTGRESETLTPSLPSPTSTNDEFDTRSTLVSTAQATRRIRTLALAVSHPRKVSTPVPPPTCNLRRVSGSAAASRFSGAGLPRAVSYTTDRRGSSGAGSAGEKAGEGQSDDWEDLRKVALDVLAALRLLEEDLRIDEAVNSPARTVFDEPESVNGAANGPAAGTGQSGEHDYDEEYSFNALAQGDEGRGQQTWEERIMSENRTYRPLDQSSRVKGAREAVRKWAEVVERIFGVSEASKSEMGAWVKGEWDGRPVELVHAFLQAYLPSELLELLPAMDPRDPNRSRDALLSRLS